MARLRLGLLATSWPSALRPYGGHFVADLAEGFAHLGHHVCVCAPRWRGDHLYARRDVSLYPAELPVQPAHLPTSVWHWPLVLCALARASRGVNGLQF